MRKNTFWHLAPILLLVCVLLLAFGAISFFFEPIIAYAELGVAAACLILAVIWLSRIDKTASRYIRRIAQTLSQNDQLALASSPFPVIVCDENGGIVWYNDLFSSQVTDGADLVGQPIGQVLENRAVTALKHNSSVDIYVGNKRYTVQTVQIPARDLSMWVLYYIENTQLKNIADEYAASRPVVMLIYIDNLDDSMHSLRASERSQIEGRVETMLEDWLSQTTGMLRKYDSDRFWAIIEQRHLQQLIASRFDILDKVRDMPIGASVHITLSIGVGYGADFAASEQMAQQAIDMALGRGGDQAAVQTANGFDFYGGVSMGVEKRTKVRPRVIASALRDSIQAADNVLIMGHKRSDLDCLGAGAALAVIARSLGKPAYVVTSYRDSMAPELIDRYRQAGRLDLFVDAHDIMPLVSPKSLLIIVDTQTAGMVECAELLERIPTVAIIDHHRKMVNYIDNAILFYHEPYASSASEMVTEVIQYMGAGTLAKPEAEALLAGIILDTRGLVIKAGVRTFEAAAYLRKQGADTVEVKRMFADSMELYREKATIVAKAHFYGRFAIACSSSDGDTRAHIAAAQAADELLTIKGVEASFSLFKEDSGISVSARSFGAVNVQLIMEALGGGGHLTMAGAQLKGIDMDEAVRKLADAIDAYEKNRQGQDG